MSEIVHINARNLLCPLPLIRLQDCVTRLSEEAEIELIATDPGVFQDIPMWCDLYGHQVISMTPIEQTHEIIVKIKIKK